MYKYLTLKSIPDIDTTKLEFGKHFAEYYIIKTKELTTTIDNNTIPPTPKYPLSKMLENKHTFPELDNRINDKYYLSTPAAPAAAAPAP